MMSIYIGLGVIIILIFAGFGISTWLSNRATSQSIAFDYSTPSPAPSTAPKPIKLADLQPIGIATAFPKAQLDRGQSEDTAVGGHGEPVDGIPCQAEMVAVHVHAHLALIASGKQVQVPAFIGMAPNSTGGCLYWLHTHGPDGIIHVEAGDPGNPNGGHYTLGNFFDIWGQPLTSSQVGPLKGAVTAYVNGEQYNGDPKTIPLRSHQQIVLEIGQPVVPPPNYKFPVND